MFEGEKVRLRGFEKKDVDKAHEAMNNSNMTQYLHVFQPHSREEEEEWIENTWEKRQKGEEYSFAVEEKKGNELIGSVSLMNIEDENKRAEIGIWIIEEK